MLSGKEMVSLSTQCNDNMLQNAMGGEGRGIIFLLENLKFWNKVCIL